MNKTFTEAIFDIFEQIAEHNKNLDSTISIPIYLAGGAAVHFYTNARRSDDVDAIMEPKRPAIPDHLGTVWDNNGVKESVTFDTNYHPYHGLIAEDFMDRAEFIKTIGKNISLYVLHPIDLVITKVLRYSDTDAEDISLLVQHPAFDIGRFKELVRDAFNSRSLESHYLNHIQWAIEAYEDHKKSDQISKIASSSTGTLKDALFEINSLNNPDTATKAKP